MVSKLRNQKFIEISSDFPAKLRFPRRSPFSASASSHRRHMLTQTTPASQTSESRRRLSPHTTLPVARISGCFLVDLLFRWSSHLTLGTYGLIRRRDWNHRLVVDCCRTRCHHRWKKLFTPDFSSRFRLRSTLDYQSIFFRSVRSFSTVTLGKFRIIWQTHPAILDSPRCWLWRLSPALGK